MSEDLSDLLNNFKNMMNSGNVPENLKQIIENIDNSSNSSSKRMNAVNTQSTPTIGQGSASQINPSANNYSIDFETILKMKNIIDNMNKKDDPRTKLLYSLKPYLRESRKKQLDQCVNLLKVTQIADIIKKENKENNNNA